MTRIKVCGVRSVDDARVCIELGVDTIGLNFWPGTKRCVSLDEARPIREAIGDAAVVVGLFVDAPLEEMRRVRDRLSLDWVQLHGDEAPEILQALLPFAYKAVRVPREPSVDPRGVARECSRYEGDRILLDAAVAGLKGGSGQTFDWSIAAELAGTRKLILAGGLTCENVEAAIAHVQPWQVDTASGVESAPGVKDREKVRRFVEAVRRADSGRAESGRAESGRADSGRPR